jgi:diacylglycerol kinase
MPKGFSIKKRLNSFVFAYRGIRYAISSQHNFIIHISLTIIAIFLGIILQISNLEWISIIIVIGIVMASEIINTSIEELVNFISPEKNTSAGRIKDLAAGAVLISAIASFIVGAIIFLPKIFELL